MANEWNLHQFKMSSWLIWSNDEKKHAWKWSDVSVMQPFRQLACCTQLRVVGGSSATRVRCPKVLCTPQAPCWQLQQQLFRHGALQPRTFSEVGLARQASMLVNKKATAGFPGSLLAWRRCLLHCRTFSSFFTRFVCSKLPRKKSYFEANDSAILASYRSFFLTTFHIKYLDQIRMSL